MKKHYIQSLCFAIALVLSGLNLFGQDSILYIRQDPATGTYASDKQFFDTLTSWGYKVKFINQSDFDAKAPTWKNYIGAFINEPVNSGKIAKFGAARDKYPVPCICFEGWAAKVANWGWLADDATDLKTNAAGSEDELSIVIKDNSHYITNIFKVGDVVKWSTNTTDIAEIAISSIKEVNVAYSHKLAKNAALEGEADYWGMVAIDSSKEFPNRLFWWGLNQYALNGKTLDHTDYMTKDLFKIVKRASEWAYRGKGTTATSVRENSLATTSNLSTYPNPASSTTTISFNSLKAANAKVTLCNVTGQQVAVLMQGIAINGSNTISLDAANYNSGIYFIKLEVGRNIEYSKLIIK